MCRIVQFVTLPKFILVVISCVIVSTVLRSSVQVSQPIRQMWHLVQQIANQTANATDTNDFTELVTYLRHWNETCRLYFEFGGRIGSFGSNQVRGIDGQKAVCLDPGLAPSSDGNCLVYSFGISDDWSFDETMETYGCDVFAFDPSLNAKDHRRSSHIQFFLMGLGTRNSRSDRTRGGWKMATLAAIRRYLNHQNRVIDYLKLDIEGDEWQVLRHLLETRALLDVKQLAVELHLLDVEKCAEYRRVIEDLEASGFVRFFSRENPWMRRFHWDTLGATDSAGYEMAWFNANYSKVSRTSR